MFWKLIFQIKTTHCVQKPLTRRQISKYKIENENIMFTDVKLSNDYKNTTDGAKNGKEWYCGGLLARHKEHTWDILKIQNWISSGVMFIGRFQLSVLFQKITHFMLPYWKLYFFLKLKFHAPQKPYKRLSTITAPTNEIHHVTLIFNIFGKMRSNINQVLVQSTDKKWKIICEKLYKIVKSNVLTMLLLLLTFSYVHIIGCAKMVMRSGILDRNICECLSHEARVVLGTR